MIMLSYSLVVLLMFSYKKQDKKQLSRLCGLRNGELFGVHIRNELLQFFTINPSFTKGEVRADPQKVFLQ